MLSEPERSLQSETSSDGHRRAGLLTLAAVVGPPLAAWCIVFAAVPPNLQEFGLNDDITYSAGLFDMLNGRGVRYFHWAAAPQLGQWLWATPFVLVLGQTFVATRVATVVLSGLGSLALFDLLCRESRISVRVSALATAAYSLNPLLFMASGTFMTDVPALSFSLIALAAVSRSLKAAESNRTPLACALLGTVAAVLAVATRQNAIVVPFVIALMLSRARGAITTRPWLALPAAVPLVSGVGVAMWLAQRPDVIYVAPQLPSVDHLIRLHASIVIYMGLFVAPLLLLAAWERHLRAVAAFVAMVAVGAAGWVLYLRGFRGRTILEGGLFPYIGNMLTAYGSFGTDLVLGSRIVVISEALRYALTLAACVGGGWLLYQAFRQWRQRAAVDPLVALGVLHAPILYVSPHLFDRYLLPLLPAAISICLWNRLPAAPEPRRTRVIATAALVALMGLASIALMHDWLAWNAARWSLGRRAISEGRPAAAIEGGYEWDYWFALKDGRWRPPGDPAAAAPGLAIPFNASLVSGLTGECGLSFSQLPGTTVVDTEPYRAWLAGGTKQFLLVCRRNP